MDIGSGTKGAISGGLYNVDIGSSSVEISCPTGNCTWPSYTSLGVCSACQNISALDHQNMKASKGEHGKLAFRIDDGDMAISTYDDPYVEQIPSTEKYRNLDNYCIVESTAMYWPSP